MARQVRILGINLRMIRPTTRWPKTSGDMPKPEFRPRLFDVIPKVAGIWNHGYNSHLRLSLRKG